MRDEFQWEPGTCGTCAWLGPRVGKGRECRLHPPDVEGRYSVVLVDQWCGDWQYAGDKLRRGPGRYRGNIEKAQTESKEVGDE